MYCFKCGNQISNNSRFCSYCGAKMENVVSKKEDVNNKNILVNARQFEENVRKGTLVYLQDIVSLEFYIYKLQNEIRSRKETIIIHDNWFYWKCYDLAHPIDQNYSDIRGIIEKIWLSYSYKLNRYYFSFLDHYQEKNVFFEDYNGRTVNHRFGLRNGSWVMDKKTRDKLCTLPVFEKKGFFREKVTVKNFSSIYWEGKEVFNPNNWDGFAEVKNCIEHFESLVKERERNYSESLPTYNKKTQELENALENAKGILKKFYNLNIIPAKYRNIGCMYFIYDFFSTSNMILKDVFLHLDLDKIQSQLSTVISNQQESILQQAQIIAQNEEIIVQNEQLFKTLSNMSKEINNRYDNIHEISINMSQWAEMAALNTEACTWIGLANYFK